MSTPYVDGQRFLAPILKEEGTVFSHLLQAAMSQLEILYRKIRQKQYLYNLADYPVEKDDPIYKVLGGHLTYQEELDWVKQTVTALLASYGYEANMALIREDQDPETVIQYLQDELQTLWFKVNLKGTRSLYNYYYKVQGWGHAQYPMCFNSGSFRIIFDRYKSLNNLETFLQEGNTPSYQIFGGSDLNGNLLLGFDPLEPQEVNDGVFKFDDGKVFDSQGIAGWQFDFDGAYQTTAQLALLQLLDRTWTDTNDQSCLSLPEHLQYMNLNMKYARKATHVPRCGVELSLMYRGGSSALAIDDRNGAYTIYPIQANVINTPLYVQPQLGTGLKVFDLDESLTFDQQPFPEYFDGDYSTAQQLPVDEAFKRIIVGTGKKGLPSINYPRLQTYVALHINGNSIPITDCSLSSIPITSTFTEDDLYEGVSGLGMKFTDSTTHTVEVTGHPLNLAATGEYNVSYAFWVKLDEKPNAGDTLNLLSVSNDTPEDFFTASVDSDGVLFVSLCGETPQSSEVTLEVGEWTFVAITYVHGEAEYTLYVNDVKKTLATVVSLPSDTLTTITLNPSGVTSGSFGLDEVRVYVTTLNDAEVNYLYEAKLGYNGLLHQPVFQTPLLLEPEEASEWAKEGSTYRFRVAQSWITGNTINVDTLKKIDETTYEKELKWTPQTKGVKVTFTTTDEGGGTWTLKDDGRGNLVQDLRYDIEGNPLARRCSGTVDYVQKTVAFNAYYDDVHKNEGHVTDETGDLDFTLHAFSDPENLPEGDLHPGSIVVKLFFGSAGTTVYSGVDDSGSFTGDLGVGIDWASSTINYETGVIHLALNEGSNPPTSTTVSYSLRRLVTVDENYPIELVYTTTDPDFAITEAAIVDDAGKNMVYATFPPIKLKDASNIIKVNFIEVLQELLTNTEEETLE